MSAKQLVKKMLLSPLGAPLRRRYQGLGTILVYHRVIPNGTDMSHFSPQSGLAVSEQAFREQMELISREYSPISLGQAVAILEGDQSQRQKPFVVVTFDDGYQDNLELALPILEEFQIPATIFVTSGFIDRSHHAWWLHTGSIIKAVELLDFSWRGQDYYFTCETVEEKQRVFERVDKIMKVLPLEEQVALLDVIERSAEVCPSFVDEFLTWEQVRTLYRHPLITIGAHTVSHAPLAACSAVDLGAELGRGRDRINEELGEEPLFFAFPYGQKEECSQREFQASELAGFKAAVTTRPGHIQTEHRRAMHALPRLAVDYFMTLSDVRELVLSGLSAFLKQRGRVYITD